MITPGEAQAGSGGTGGTACLPSEQRLDLLGKARFRVATALDAYTSACAAHQAAIARTASTNQTFVFALLDVALGLAMPAFVRGFMKLLNNKLPVGSPELVYELAYDAMTPQVAVPLVTAATKTGAATLRARASSLLGENEAEAFISSLKVHAHAAADVVSEGLTGADDLTIRALWAAFDPAITNYDSYAAVLEGLLSRFRSQVQPIGERSTSGSKRFGVVDHTKISIGLVADSCSRSEPTPDTARPATASSRPSRRTSSRLRSRSMRRSMGMQRSRACGTSVASSSSLAWPLRRGRAPRRARPRKRATPARHPCS